MADRGRPFVRWLLLDGDRHVVAGTLLLLVFGVLWGLGHVGLLATGDPGAVRGIAGSLVPGLFTFLSIVLAINQLVLSQEFGSADEIRERFREIRAFRSDVEAAAEEAPSPVRPTAFLDVVVGTVGAAATALEESVPADVDAAPRREIADYVSTVHAAVAEADRVLEESDPGRVNAILPVLEYRDSWQLYEARRIRQEYGDALPAATERALEDLVDALELFSVARTHFRTTYTQRVLARLSRLLLYVGVPALLAAVVLGLLEVTAAVPGPYGEVVVAALLTVAFSPLAVLFAYILRIAAVSERTIAVGPFVSRPGAAEAASESAPADATESVGDASVPDGEADG